MLPRKGAHVRDRQRMSVTPNEDYGGEQEGVMSEKQYRDQIDRYTAELARLANQELDAKTSARKSRENAAAARRRIKPTTSPSMARSYENSASRADRQAEASEKKVADFAQKASRVRKQLSTAEENLARVQKAATRKEEQATKRRQRDELDHAKKVARLSQPVVRHIYEVRELPAPKAEELRLLYLTANPILDEDHALRVDAEVAQVRRAVRGALHRDYVRIEHRPAATPEDLLDGLNDLTPHVVHFSGHAGDQALALDNSDVDRPRPRLLQFEQLGRALGTAGTTPTLLVLNACDTVAGAAEELLPSVPIVIAMASSVLDSTAAVFAARFYAAIAAGLSVQRAFDQAVLAVELAGLEDETWMITLLVRDDVDPDAVMLVRPPVDPATEK